MHCNFYQFQIYQDPYGYDYHDAPIFNFSVHQGISAADIEAVFTAQKQKYPDLIPRKISRKYIVDHSKLAQIAALGFDPEIVAAIENEDYHITHEQLAAYVIFFLNLGDPTLGAFLETYTTLDFLNVR